ncbi:MAG TPA: SAM-dependent methyltransferase [Chitinophagaceae bacterium]|nr:SAM-dependent methyltransferase [Chitinophagaceae bacterium]
MESAAGTLYLIPCTLSEGMDRTIPPQTREKALQLRHFFVEQERTARHFLKLLDPSIPLDEVRLYRMDQHHPADLEVARQILKSGKDLGILSEAGCPGIADPGNTLVRLAHGLGARVIPLTGPSSILLALMASGMNGQQFRFNGYLPVKSAERIQAIRELEQQSTRQRLTQIFIETPYRNNQLVADILQTCQPDTRLCIAAGITGPGEFIRTLPVRGWKTQIPELHKVPATFLLDAENSR